jgi:hypothetical protein
MALPTAGSKYLICDKKIFTIYGQDLDRLYETVKNKYCSICEFCKPHDEGWKWTYKYQKEREKELDNLISND